VALQAVDAVIEDDHPAHGVLGLGLVNQKLVAGFDDVAADVDGGVGAVGGGVDVGPVEADPKARDQLDLTDYNAEDEPYEVAYAHPTWLSVDSVAILRALEERKVTKGELAERLHVRPAVVERLTDPFYFQHNSVNTRRVADALDMDTELRLFARSKLRGAADRFRLLPVR